nr:MAG TPA: hypothetical protein [Caudoviricetes sp.]
MLFLQKPVAAWFVKPSYCLLFHLLAPVSLIIENPIDCKWEKEPVHVKILMQAFAIER